MKILIGLLIPFLGTMLGSAMVFLLKGKINKLLYNKLVIGGRNDGIKRK